MRRRINLIIFAYPVHNTCNQCRVVIVHHASANVTCRVGSRRSHCSAPAYIIKYHLLLPCLITSSSQIYSQLPAAARFHFPTLPPRRVFPLFLYGDSSFSSPDFHCSTAVGQQSHRHVKDKKTMGKHEV